MCSAQLGWVRLHAVLFFERERVLTSAKFPIAGLGNWDLLSQVKCRNLLQIHTKQPGNKEVSRQEFDGWKTPGLWWLFSVCGFWTIQAPRRSLQVMQTIFPKSKVRVRLRILLQLHLHMDGDDGWCELDCSPSFARCGLWFTEITLAYFTERKRCSFHVLKV